MKKLFILLSLFSAISSGLSAQYYYLPYFNAGQNPKGLNTDVEEPGLASWTKLAVKSSTPAWSPVTNIPIPFDFNGSPVTSFKVSTSGVLTFTTSASAVPSSTNTALPDASVPDNSICAWGLAGTGSNDSIRTKTFGTTPNRQFWIQFNSYSFPGISTSSGWTYWAIVLEETTNDIYIVDQRTYSVNTANTSLSLGIQINSSTAFSVFGSPDVASLTDGGSVHDASDNTFYRFIYGTQPANDILLTAINIPRFKMVSSNFDITGTVVNYGSAPITSFVINYQNGANVYPYTQSGVNIASGQTYNFTHTTPFNIAAPTTYPIKVWAALTGDLNQANDTLSGTVSGLSFLPIKNIVFEEATGTWCGWCPGGAVSMDSLAVVYPGRANLIAVHNYDPMVITAYDDGLTGLTGGGWPNGAVDRNINGVDPYYFFDVYDFLINDTATCEVSVNASLNSRVLTINASAHFATDLSGDYRFNAVVTEDNVKGTSSSWDQHNYFSYASQNEPLVGAGHDWQAEPNPVPAANMEYDHVARAILGGFDGEAGSLPFTINANSTLNKTFTYTVPSPYNLNNLKVIVWVSDVSTGQIVNSAKVNSIVGIEETENIHRLNIYPNPSTGIITISSAVSGTPAMKLTVMNSLGETVKAFDKLNFSSNKVIDLSGFNNGLYFLQFVDENSKSFVSKILINH